MEFLDENFDIAVADVDAESKFSDPEEPEQTVRVDRFYDLTDELKPENEIKRILADACVIKNEDPTQYYSVGSKLGQGAQSVVYKVVRI